MVERLRSVGDGELAALQPKLGGPPEVRSGGLRVVVGEGGERSPAARVRLAEVRHPVVVDAVHEPGELLVVESQAHAHNAVQHLGVHAVKRHVLQSKFRVRGVRLTVEETRREDSVQALRLPPFRHAESEARASEHPERLVLGYPHQAFVGLHNPGCHVLEPCGSIAHP